MKHNICYQMNLFSLYSQHKRLSFVFCGTSKRLPGTDQSKHEKKRVFVRKVQKNSIQIGV